MFFFSAYTCWIDLKLIYVTTMANTYNIPQLEKNNMSTTRRYETFFFHGEIGFHWILSGVTINFTKMGKMWIFLKIPYLSHYQIFCFDFMIFTIILVFCNRSLTMDIPFSGKFKDLCKTLNLPEKIHDFKANDYLRDYTYSQHGKSETLCENVNSWNWSLKLKKKCRVLEFIIINTNIL